ncbi:MAG: TonB family protein [Hydrogenophilales bacterium]|nr:TonB family protein [Hydrogenophilales bacterium]
MTTPQPTSLSPRAKSLVRLLVMVELSLVLHLAIIFGIQAGAVERGSLARPAIEARLMPAKDAPQQILVKAIDRPIKSRVEEYQPPSRAAPSDSAKPQAEQHKPGLPEAAASPTLVDAPLPLDPTYYPAREVDEHPALVGQVRPVYPAKAAKAEVKGDVLVLFMLNENGSVDEVSVLEENPPGYGFDVAVNEWLKQARFKPAMRKGRAVKSRVVYRVTFEP